MKRKTDLSYIDSMDDLKRAQRRVQLELKEQEKELRIRAQQLPGALLHEGINKIIPSFLPANLGNILSGAARQLLNIFFPRGGEGHKKWLSTLVQTGVFLAARLAWNYFKKKR